MALELETATIVSKVTGEKKMGILAKCLCPGEPNIPLYSYTFHLFQIDGQKHYHVMCGRCGETYCPGGCREADILKADLFVEMGKPKVDPKDGH